MVEVFADLNWTNIFTALIGAVVGCVAALAAAANQRKTVTHLLVDQIQEERTHAYAALAEEREVNAMLYRDKAAGRQHVADLRAQINSGQPPPPVAPPPGYVE